MKAKVEKSTFLRCHKPEYLRGHLASVVYNMSAHSERFGPLYGHDKWGWRQQPYGPQIAWGVAPEHHNPKNESFFDYDEEAASKWFEWENSFVDQIDYLWNTTNRWWRYELMPLMRNALNEPLYVFGGGVLLATLALLCVCCAGCCCFVCVRSFICAVRRLFASSRASLDSVDRRLEQLNFLLGRRKKPTRPLATHDTARLINPTTMRENEEYDTQIDTHSINTTLSTLPADAEIAPPHSTPQPPPPSQQQAASASTQTLNNKSAFYKGDEVVVAV